MKLQVTQENLARALNSVARVASARSTLPILSNILLKTTKNRLSIAATNLDIAISHTIGAKTSNEGSITVPARLMQDFITSLPAGVIDLELKDNKLDIKTEKYQSTINGVSAEEFPVMPAITKGKSWKLAANEAKTALQQVTIAASSDEARPVLTGVNIHTHGGKLYMVATDSYRLAEKEVGKMQEEISVLVPSTAAQELLRILGDDTEELKIVNDEQQIKFTVGDVELVARLIEGNYPDYRKLIPQKFATEATLKKADFVNITKVSSLFARENAGSVTLEAKTQEKQLSIKSVASQLGENNAAADAKVSSDGEITLNSRYILDALNVISGEEITLAFNGKLEPFVLRDTKDSSYIHIIMPLKS